MKHQGPVIDRVEGYEVIDCKTCKFKHVNPIPTIIELQKLYDTEFYTGKKPDYFKDAEEDIEWWMATYKNYFELIKKHTDKRKLLDIGSGPGYFLKCGKEMGFKVTGLEPSPEAAKYSKKLGVNVINDFFDSDSHKKIGKFNIVSLNFILEHVPNPTSFLKEIHDILSPGGLFFLLSPNDYNPFQQILKNNMGFKPWWVVPEQHINYFDFDSAKKLLKRTGFIPLEVTTTYPMELFLLSGDNYIGNREIGRKCHQKRKIFELKLLANNPKLLNTFYQTLAKKNLGREFIILAKKQIKQ